MPNGAYLLPQDGGSVYFDAVLTEETDRSAQITEHGVEVGANIADHYRLALTGIRLEVFVSQEPIDPSIHPGGQGTFQHAELLLPQFPAISDFSTALTVVANPAGTLIRALRATPGSITVNSLQYAVPFDSLSDLLSQLDTLRQNATLIDVVTKSWYYASYLLGDVTTKRDKDTGTGTRVSLSLKQVRTVTTRKVPAPPIPQKPKDKPLVNKGAQQTKDPGPMKSIAASAVDGARSYFAGGGA